MLAIVFSTLALLLFLSKKKPMWWLYPSFSLVMSLHMLMYSLPHINYYSMSIFTLDQLSISLIIITLWVSALMFITSQKVYLYYQSPHMFSLYILLLMGILCAAFSLTNFMMFYILFEASLIPTLLLVMGWGYQPERIQASFYLMMYTVTASLPLLISATMIFKSSGHLSMMLFVWPLFLPNNLMTVWWVVMIAAFLVKTPLYMTHLWLPKAHVEAPVAGSMILAGVLLKLGGYGMLRLATKFISLVPASSAMIMSISLVGGAITSFICIRQTDVKSLIAYSSVSHMGLATAGILSNTLWGWSGALMMLIAHGLCSSCMFALANMTYEAVNSRSLYLSKGLMNMFPSLTFWWFCFSACNMAAPPSLNLASEIMLISSNMSNHMMYVIPLSVMAFMAASYSLILYTSTQHGTPPPFLNPSSLHTHRNYSICLLHLTPLILFIMKADLVSNWIW